MVLGLQMYGVLAKRAASDEEIIGSMKKIGLQQMEPCIQFDDGYDDSNPSFWSVEKFERLYPQIREAGITVVTCFVIAGSVKKSAEKMYYLAEKYQIPFFILNMPSDHSKEGLVRAAADYRELSDLLKKAGARPLIHNGKPDTEIMMEGMTSYEYMVELCEGKVGMQFDIGWGAAGGVDPIAFLQKNDSRIESIHFKDFEQPGVSAGDIYIGGGSVDSETALKIGLAKKVPLFIDQDNYAGAGIEEDMLKSYQFLCEAERRLQ